MQELVIIILFLQIPILICIITICILLDKVHYIQNLNLIAWGWGFNLLYIITTLLTNYNIDHIAVSITSNLSDIVCSFFFVIASYKHLNTSFFSSVKKIHWSIILTIFILACLFELPSIFQSDTTYFILSHVPAVLVNMIGIICLAFFYRQIEDSFRTWQILFSSILLYAFIQPLALMPEDKLNIAIPFSVGLLSKIFILIALGNLSITIIKSLNKADVNLSLEKAFTEKLNLILGRTFHEITPPLLEIETISGELIDSEGTHSPEFPINKRVRLEILKIENAVNRMRTILAASVKLYRDGVNPKGSLELGLPFPIENELGINNLNTLIQIAIVNFQSLMLRDAEFNHFEDNKLKVHTDYGGNCNIHCNSVEIIQVLLNLIKNSFEASVNGKCRIFIKTKNTSSSDENGNSIRLVTILFEDNGHGVSSEVFPRIFDQGFSTKGTTDRGFGLSVIKSHIESNGGTIEITSPVSDPHLKLIDGEIGTRFLISFVVPIPQLL